MAELERGLAADNTARGVKAAADAACQQNRSIALADQRRLNVEFAAVLEVVPIGSSPCSPHPRGANNVPSRGPLPSKSGRLKAQTMMRLVPLVSAPSMTLMLALRPTLIRSAYAGRGVQRKKAAVLARRPAFARALAASAIDDSHCLVLAYRYHWHGGQDRSKRQRGRSTVLHLGKGRCGSHSQNADRQTRMRHDDAAWNTSASGKRGNH